MKPANTLFNKLVNKMKVMSNQTVGMLGNSKVVYAAFYKISYANAKHDFNPLIFCMGQYQGNNGKNYTHAFNTNYIQEGDKMWLARMVYLLHKGAQAIDAKTLYNMIKIQRPSMIKSAYRIYFSNMISNQKMVCSGLTNMNSLVYKIPIPNWLALLNKNLQPSAMLNSAPVAINSTELQDRITMAKNAIPLNQARVVTPLATPSPFGSRTPFGGSPFGGR